MMQTLQQPSEHLCDFHAPSGQSAWSPRPDIAKSTAVTIVPPLTNESRITIHVFLWNLLFFEKS